MGMSNRLYLGSSGNCRPLSRLGILLLFETPLPSRHSEFRVWGSITKPTTSFTLAPGPSHRMGEGKNIMWTVTQGDARRTRFALGYFRLPPSGRCAGRGEGMRGVLGIQAPGSFHGGALADEAAGSGVGLGFFGSLFPPADFALEVEPAADRFCVFEGLDVVWNPSQDDTFAADNGNVVMDGWLGHQVGWIHPAGTQTATIFPTNTG